MATFEELDRYAGLRLKVRCGKCRRVLDEFVPDPATGELQSVGEPLGPDELKVAAQGRLPQVRVHRPSTTWVYSDNPVGAVDPRKPIPGRMTFSCHPRCGARYTVRADRLAERWLVAARAGRTEVVLGEG